MINVDDSRFLIRFYVCYTCVMITTELNYSCCDNLLTLMALMYFSCITSITSITSHRVLAYKTMTCSNVRPDITVLWGHLYQRHFSEVRRSGTLDFLIGPQQFP